MESRSEGWGDPSVSCRQADGGERGGNGGFALAQEVREEGGRWLRREEDKWRKKHKMFQMWWRSFEIGGLVGGFATDQKLIISKFERRSLFSRSRCEVSA